MQFPLKVAPRKGYRGSLRDYGAERSGGRQHAGIDLLALVGTEVLAMADGVTAEFVPRFYTDSDQAISIIHGNITVRYCEISVLAAFRKKGVSVKCGQVIGSVSVLTENNSAMLHLETYNYEKYMTLTDRTRLPFQRAVGLIDPRPTIEAAAAASGITIPTTVASFDEKLFPCNC